MKIGDYICINSGLDVYQTVYTAAAFLGPAAYATAFAAAAQVSRGIGQVTDLGSTEVCIKWLKGNAWSWWYTRKEIEQNFHVIKDSNLIKVLYG